MEGELSCRPALPLTPLISEKRTSVKLGHGRTCGHGEGTTSVSSHSIGWCQSHGHIQLQGLLGSLAQWYAQEEGKPAG